MADPYRIADDVRSGLSEEERAAIVREILAMREKAEAERAAGRRRRERALTRMLLVVAAALTVAYFLVGFARR